jgi:hypothetical protein
LGAESGGRPEIERILGALVGLFVAAFGERIHSAYLVGSQADGTAGAGSDIDLRIVFRDDFLPGELERFAQVRRHLRDLSPLEIDCPPLSQQRLLTDEDWLHETLSIKMASRWLYGPDLRPELPLPALDAFTRHVSAAPILFMRRLRGNPPRLSLPLGYPDPGGPFLGYNARLSPLDPPEGNLKLLVQVPGFIASSLLAIQAGQIVASKNAWLEAYRAHIGGPWLPYLETLYRRVRLDWAYAVPDPPEERAELQGLCRQTLQYENYYLAEYRSYLLSELAKRPEFARQRLAEIGLSG